MTRDIDVVASLESLSGLDRVASVSSLTLAENPVLSSLSGLHGLTRIGGLIAGREHCSPCSASALRVRRSAVRREDDLGR